MSKSHALALLLLRLSFGLTIAAHGARHLADFDAFVPKAGGTALALCAIAGELGGGLGLAFGLLTRLAGLGLGAVMLAIAFTKYPELARQLGTGAATAFEYPFLTGVLGVSFLFSGAGPFSLDEAFFGKKKPGRLR
jgi:putative oxidoreductase